MNSNQLQQIERAVNSGGRRRVIFIRRGDLPRDIAEAIIGMPVIDIDAWAGMEDAGEGFDQPSEVPSIAITTEVITPVPTDEGHTTMVFSIQGPPPKFDHRRQFNGRAQLSDFEIKLLDRVRRFGIRISLIDGREHFFCGGQKLRRPSVTRLLKFAYLCFADDGLLGSETSQTLLVNETPPEPVEAQSGWLAPLRRAEDPRHGRCPGSTRAAPTVYLNHRGGRSAPYLQITSENSRA
jgi:hypothetical protein